MKVYIVTEGYYSDQHIVGVFSTAEKAKEYSDTHDDGQVEDWDVDHEKPDERARWWIVYIRIDSGDETQAPHSYWGRRWDKNQMETAEEVGAGVIRATSIVSAAHAQKLAAEKRQHLLRTMGDKPSSPPAES